MSAAVRKRAPMINAPIEKRFVVKPSFASECFPRLSKPSKSRARQSTANAIVLAIAAESQESLPIMNANITQAAMIILWNAI